jgi:hypothetical protein
LRQLGDRHLFDGKGDKIGAANDGSPMDWLSKPNLKSIDP